MPNYFDDQRFGSLGAGGEGVALTARHVQTISRAMEAIERARQPTQPELLAAELRLALDELGQVLGQVTPDDVLGRIFSSFCIGK